MNEVTAIKPTLVRSPLTGTVYVLLKNGQKRAVPEAEVVAVIASFLDDRHLTVTQDDGFKRHYIVIGEHAHDLTVRQQAERTVRQMIASGHAPVEIAVEMAVEVVVLNDRIKRLGNGSTPPPPTP